MTYCLNFQAKKGGNLRMEKWPVKDLQIRWSPLVDSDGLALKAVDVSHDLRAGISASLASAVRP
jgi:hypothetical protein